MKRRQIGRIGTMAGIVAIGALVAFMVYLQVLSSQFDTFRHDYEQVVVDVNSLTSEYQAEEGKWRTKQYDNSTMISIVDKYTPKYQDLVDRAQSLNTPEKYKTSQDFLVKAIESEKQSNEHFKQYLVTGDPKEYDLSSKLLSDSLSYSVQADAAIKAAG